MALNRLLDLSHTIEHGMTTYRGLPAPIICDYLSRDASRQIYAAGTEFHIGRIDMVANTGTYLDSPFHRFEDGTDLSGLSLDVLANLEIVIVRVPSSAGRAVGVEHFSELDLRGKALLVDTGWCRHWRTDRYFDGHPYLTRDAAAQLAEYGVRLVGIDSYNIDNTDDGHRPVHTILLGNGIPIVEHMASLKNVPESGGRFFAVPPKVARFGTFPVRAFCTIA